MKMQNKTILITGGAGFVGSNLAIYLKKLSADYKIICLDNLKRRGSELNLARLKENAISFEHGDIRNQEDIQNIEFDILIECSAEPSVHAGYNSSPAYLINTNLMGTINCLEAARKNSADFIFLSTSRVYPMKSLSQLPLKKNDNRFELPDDFSIIGCDSAGINELFDLNGSRTLYGATKLSSELIIQEYISMYGLRAIINRCGVISGAWQMGKVDQGFLSLWVSRHIYKNKPLSYIGYGGTGLQVRDVLNINDLCKLIEMQIENFDMVNGKTYNVGGGKSNSVSLKELTKKCQLHTGNFVDIDAVAETSPADIPYYVTDNSKIYKELGWKPNYSIDDTIIQIKDWILDNYDDLLKVF